MDRQQLYSFTVLYLIFALATTCVGKFAPADLKNKIYIGKQRDDINKLINSSPKADLGYAVPCGRHNCTKFIMICSNCTKFTIYSKQFLIVVFTFIFRER